MQKGLTLTPEKARTPLRTTFKNFTLLPRNTNGKIIKKFMRYCFHGGEKYSKMGSKEKQNNPQL